MTLTQQGPNRVVTPSFVGCLAAFAVFGAGSYAFGNLLPYYVNDLHHLPLQEITYNHDPKDLWPQGPLAFFVSLAGFLSLLFTPLILGLSAILSAGVLLFGFFVKSERPSPGLTLMLVGVIAGCVVGLDYVGSPMWNALATWRLD